MPRSHKKLFPEPITFDEVLNDTDYKDVLYDRLAALIQVKVDAQQSQTRKLGKAATKEVFEAVIEMIFAQATHAGYFRFPLGYGALKVREFKGAAKPKIMPTREDLPVAPVAQPGDRLHLRFSEGTAVRQALGTYRLAYRRKTKRRSRLEPVVVVLDAAPV